MNIKYYKRKNKIIIKPTKNKNTNKLEKRIN